MAFIWLLEWLAAGSRSHCVMRTRGRKAGRGSSLGIPEQGRVPVHHAGWRGFGGDPEKGIVRRCVAATDRDLLLSEALELDPKNVDAMLAMKRHLPPMLPDAEIEFMQKIVAIAEAGLGSKIFEEMGGHFWGFMETRPYMRARASLADALHAAGRGAEAVSEWEGMLTLNPNDNQGMRYRLLSACLQLGRMDEVRELLGRYPECEFSTVFAWATVLERFVSGDLYEALEAVAVAQKQNAFAKAYLLGHRRIPKNLPVSYAMGSKEEAACFAQDLQAAWSVYPAARKWLEGLKPKKR